MLFLILKRRGLEIKLHEIGNMKYIVTATLNKKVFISSVISDFEEYRHANKRAVEIMGDRPVTCLRASHRQMSEDSGARPYSPEKACITVPKGA